jgi:hypothetical protein
MHWLNSSRCICDATEIFKSTSFLGYADSSPITPSKTGVVQDALKVYEFAIKHSKGLSPIIGMYQ